MRALLKLTIQQKDTYRYGDLVAGGEVHWDKYKQKSDVLLLSGNQRINSVSYFVWLIAIAW